MALKYLLPLLLIPFPFLAGWGNFVLDSVDGDLLIPLGLSDPVYQQVDKSADYVTYLCMVVAAWRWPLRQVVVGLFALRTAGQALFFITGNEIVFFLFPNFLEPLFLVYATILAAPRRPPNRSSHRRRSPAEQRVIEGFVNAAHEAVIRLFLQGAAGRPFEVEAVVDTGFNRFIALPVELIVALEATPAGSNRVVLGDGSDASLDVYGVTVLWEGVPKRVDAYAADTTPLVGCGYSTGIACTSRSRTAGASPLRPADRLPSTHSRSAR